MTRSTSMLAAPLATLATALVMPLILSLTPQSANALPTPLAAQAISGVSSGQLA